MSWPLTSFQRNRFHRSSACSTLLLVTLGFEFHCSKIFFAEVQLNIITLPVC